MRGVHKKTQQQVAVKVINKDQCEADQLEQQRKEIEILKISQHPHIIQLLDLFENESKIFISKRGAPHSEQSSSTWAGAICTTT